LAFNTELAILAFTAAICLIMSLSLRDAAQALTASVLGLVFWGGTAWMWLIDNNGSDRMLMAWIFLAPAFVCLAICIGAGLTLFEGSAGGKVNPFE
jgi:hypothetical protein